MRVNNADRQERIKRIFGEALEKPAGERAAWLAEACAGDEPLRREVESLLGYETAAGDFIETPAVNLAARLLAEDLTKTGRRIGPYLVRSRIGAGGMGEVWLAEDPRLHRKVALKLLSAHFTADPERIRRFEREARAASALNHPNILTIYEIGRSESQTGEIHFIATEFIEGQTLRQRLLDGPIPMIEALEIARQIAGALDAAHAAGIVHRDIKPENVMLRPDGYVKVLDFGLARITHREVPRAVDSSAATRSIFTDPGRVMGTAGYMSPEQARGEETDGRTDLFSLGVVLYEMLAGTRPFTGATSADILVSLLEKEPPPLSFQPAEAARELQPVLSRALAKNRAQRYQQCGEVLADLKRVREEFQFEERLRSKEREKPTGARAPTPRSPRRRRARMALAGIAAIALLAIGGTAWWVGLRMRAHRQIPEIERLAREQNFFRAYDLALEARKYLPDDPRLNALLPGITDSLTVTSEPPGARVYLRRYLPDAPEQAQRVLFGLTPLANRQVARGEYLLSIEKEGYASFERTISSRLSPSGVAMLPPDAPTSVHQRLIETARMAPRMVFVPGGRYRLVSWDKPTGEEVELADYFIDKYEVTNREYREFITAGGYLKRQYWRHPFIRNGKTQRWEEAMTAFTDRTGLAGPRSWAGQTFPEGRDEYPVTDITWHEAAAYAAFRGKQLPTIFQWEKAARNGLFTHYSANIMPWGPIDVTSTRDRRANFKSDGPQPVGSYEFGMGPFGSHDMAGNVAEWCLNETTDGFTTAGGSWDDLAYLFGYVGELPAFHASGKLGFRCAMSSRASEADPGAMKIDTSEQVPAYAPVSAAAFRDLLGYYRYDPAPLEARVVETIETPDWRREKITYLGAREDRAIAYLYLPKSSPGPHQVLQFVPAGDVYGRYLTLPEGLEMILTPHLRAGRAVFAVVFRGFREREHPAGYTPSPSSSVKRRAEIITNATDLRRGLDYLAARPDIDAGRIAFFGYSQGATEGLIYAAVDERYRAVVLVAGGMGAPRPGTLSEIAYPNFAAHLRAPKLVLNGRFDEVHPLRTMIEPLYNLFPQPKKLVLYDGSHTPPIDIAVPAINQWLDETLGPVRR
ncbi:MAG: SUMF1/EgtB/PvdO family nonheme iron enzyme [Blastocatellia bacterium]|nr:SUMF1/EgtB/PvdO family nonheme iron enzyme [Blastocatellia bacterium]